MAGFDTALEQFIGQNTPEKLKAREANPLITPASRSFLFLQGVCSPFFSRLTKSLRDIGQQVQCVNFNVGDVLYNPGTRTLCSAHAGELESFYKRILHSLDITDLVLFGDCRPVHLPAIALARSAGIRVHVFEEGYFRPYWVTLERGGVNNHSQLPATRIGTGKSASSFRATTTVLRSSSRLRPAPPTTCCITAAAR